MNSIMCVIWLAAAVVFGIMEAATVALTSIWFALGAVGAMLCALCGGALWLQALVFVALTATTLLLTRRFARTSFNTTRQATNADRIIGAEGIVTVEIDNTQAVGQILVNGQVWSARSVDGSVLPAESRVTVRSIAGVKAMVERVAEP